MGSNTSIGGNKAMLSFTDSSAVSMASAETDEHRDLYDHRQHSDLPAARRASLSHADSGGACEDFNYHFKRGVNQGITFEDDSDQEYSTMPPHSIQYSSATRSPSMRPSRVAHSLSNQKQLFKSSNNVRGECKQEQNRDPQAVNSSRRESLVLSVIDSSTKKKIRAQSDSSSQGAQVYLVARSVSHKSQDSNLLNSKLNRKKTNDTGDSNVSRESQETEEDVCFPMQQPGHTRVNGIDFGELEEFVAESARVQVSCSATTMVSNTVPCYNGNLAGSSAISSGSSISHSSAARKYVPKESLTQKTSLSDTSPPVISFGNNKVETENYSTINNYADANNLGGNFDLAAGVGSSTSNYTVPDRFSLFRSGAGDTIHAPDLPSLLQEGQTFHELFSKGLPTWWLDCICPTDEEMRCIAKAFGIHPLTAEDIRMQETREKVELFKSYYFVCFHTFENDFESEDFLEPINIYIVIFRNGVLTFHFTPVSHSSNVRRRVRQLRDYVDVNSDWICYALIDDITDSFAPVIQSIEYEADVIEDSVFHSRDMDISSMLRTIGEGRRKTMILMRLLSGKADVIKMFSKRCQDEVNGIGPALTSEINIANLQFQQANHSQTRNFQQFMFPSSHQQPSDLGRTQLRADIALYLGDIQDHVVTMFQNLLSYEKIFSRSHSNYLAQLQVESFHSNNKVTEMLGKVTLIGTMLVPLNVITGLFGMNVKVPGDDQTSIFWFIGIVLFLVFLAVTSWFFSSWWISRANKMVTLNEAAEAGTKSLMNFNKFLKPPGQKPKIMGNKSILSRPSRYFRYM